MKTYLILATAACALIAGQAQAATFLANGNGFIVPFGQNVQTSTATVGATPGTISSLTFTLDLLVHTSARDLTATVTHGGTTATLFSNLPCCDALLGQYAFSSTAGTPLADADGFLIYLPGTYSFTYASAGSFIGADAAGPWTLSVADDRRLGVGALSGWSVSGQTATAAAVPEPATWAMLLVGFGAVGAAMRQRRRVRTSVSFA